MPINTQYHVGQSVRIKGSNRRWQVRSARPDSLRVTHGSDFEMIERRVAPSLVSPWVKA